MLPQVLKRRWGLRGDWAEPARSAPVHNMREALEVLEVLVLQLLTTPLMLFRSEKIMPNRVH